MSNWLLTAKHNVSSPGKGVSFCKNPRDLEKGFQITVAARSTGGPSHEDVIGALLLAGFNKEEAECYNSSSWKYHFDGVECGEVDFKLSEKQFDAQLRRNDKSYYFQHEKENEKKLKEAEKEARDARRSSKDSDGCCPSSSLSNSICNQIINEIPLLRCIIDCFC